MPTSKEEEKLYMMWWLHDGQWYQNVAKRFGFDAANEINKEAARFMARRSMQMLVRERGVDTDEITLDEAVELYMTAAKNMWADGWVELEASITGDDTFDVTTTKNFALQWIDKAGTLDKYDCPCLELREGWFKGLGIRKFEQGKNSCMCDGAEACTFWAKVNLPSAANQEEVK